MILNVSIKIYGINFIRNKIIVIYNNFYYLRCFGSCYFFTVALIFLQISIQLFRFNGSTMKAVAETEWKITTIEETETSIVGSVPEGLAGRRPGMDGTPMASGQRRRVAPPVIQASANIIQRSCSWRCRPSMRPAPQDRWPAFHRPPDALQAYWLRSDRSAWHRRRSNRHDSVG